MISIIGQLFTLGMIILGSILLYQHFLVGKKRPVTRPATRRASVKRFAAKQQPTERQIVSWPTAIGYLIAAYTSVIRLAIADFRKGWRAGKAVFAMSSNDEPKPETEPVTADVSVEREREPGIGAELAAEQADERDIIVPQTKELTKTQKDRLLAKYKSLVEQGLLSASDIAVLMYGRTDDRRQQIIELFDSSTEKVAA